MNKYPIYIPSKGRADVCYTAQCFLKDKVDFKIVVEPAQLDEYKKYYNENLILVLPENGLRLLGSRLWIREHSKKNGFERHWQFDDNIRVFRRLHKGKRIRCNANIAIKVVEDFTDRYENIGLSGFNYTFFAVNEKKTPFTLNCHVYSASLISNTIPYKWRLYYNDDTDLCLQILTSKEKLCTVLFHAFLVDKMATMVVKGGNTEDLYKTNGRLIMARALEEVWPELVETKWRYGRPQHVVKNSWKDFKNPLIRRGDIDWNEIENKKYDIKLKQVKEIKSKNLREYYKNNK
jgi:hypothetical protein